jgi:hypothetical protein
MVLPLPGSCGRMAGERPSHNLAEVIKIGDQAPGSSRRSIRRGAHGDFRPPDQSAAGLLRLNGRLKDRDWGSQPSPQNSAGTIVPSSSHAPEGGDGRERDLEMAACDILAAIHEGEKVRLRRIDDHQAQLIEISGQKERASFCNCRKEHGGRRLYGAANINNAVLRKALRRSSISADCTHGRPIRRLISSELMPSLAMIAIRDGAARSMRRDHERNVGCTCVAQFPAPGLE